MTDTTDWLTTAGMNTVFIRVPENVRANDLIRRDKTGRDFGTGTARHGLKTGTSDAVG
jgi:hypothetical protein